MERLAEGSYWKKRRLVSGRAQESDRKTERLE
jgi:hypothetical protein